MMSHSQRKLGSKAAVWIVVATASLATNSAPAQQLSAEAQELVATWLMTNCGVGTEPALEGRLRAMGESLEPAFLEALTQGPSESLLREAEQSAAERFQRRQALLQGDVELGLSEKALDSARRVERNEFVDRQVTDFIARFKSQAVAGLGLVDGPRARRALEELAADERSELQSAARRALEQLGR
jgi:hypothetical protein